MTNERHRLFYFMLEDWTWWVWTLTAVLLTLGLFGRPDAFIAAMIVTLFQLAIVMLRERSVFAFAVQIRVAYLALLVICFIPQMRWLYWWPVIGTFALVIFGYCFLGRVLSLFPGNRKEVLSTDLLRRTFFSRPNLSRVSSFREGSGCAGGLCAIEAQVAQGASIISPRLEINKTH
jgi:hypothetical protein